MRTASGNLAVGVNDGVDGDHTGENGLGLVVNVDEDALGIEDGGEEVLDVNAELIRDWRSSCQCEENPLIGLDAPLSWIPLSHLSCPRLSFVVADRSTISPIRLTPSSVLFLSPFFLVESLV